MPLAARYKHHTHYSVCKRMPYQFQMHVQHSKWQCYGSYRKGAHHIDMVKAYEGAEEPDVCLGELVASNVPLPAENGLCLVKCFKHLPATSLAPQCGRHHLVCSVKLKHNTISTTSSCDTLVADVTAQHCQGSNSVPCAAEGAYVTAPS